MNLLVYSRISFLFICIILIAFNINSLSAQDKPNIVWVVCEDISPFIGAYGDAIVRTPNIDKLASEGVLFTKVYTTAGVCSPSRSSIITGMNQISIGTQHHRTKNNPKLMPEGVPGYSAVPPPEVKAFPEYLRIAGYYTTNNAKEDYQFEEPVTVWDESSVGATYRNRPAGMPFFSVFNIAVSHESFIINPPDSLYYDPADMTVPMYYEDTKQIRYDMAALYTRVEQMDQDLGEVINQLKEDGVYDNSYVIFYSDHGGTLPWTKREVLKRGTHIPLIVKYPDSKLAGTVNNALISSIDFAPSMLSIAGIPAPAYLQGKAFLGPLADSDKNAYVFHARDRMADKYDRVRAVTDGTFRYIYNFRPELPKYQDLAYRNQIPSMAEILAMRDAGKLDNPYLLDWFKSPKPVEELYYTAKDPDEVHNLAANPDYNSKKSELKEVLFQWLKEVGDSAEIPESEMVVMNWWQGKNQPPKTAAPVIKPVANGVYLECKTPGASMGYRIFDESIKDTTITRTIRTWDFQFFISSKNGNTIEVPLPWMVYSGGTIPLKKGQTILVNAQRIGYLPTERSYKL